VTPLNSGGLSHVEKSYASDGTATFTNRKGNITVTKVQPRNAHGQFEPSRVTRVEVRETSNPWSARMVYNLGGNMVHREWGPPSLPTFDRTHGAHQLDKGDRATLKRLIRAHKREARLMRRAPLRASRR
jgi:hypothetical protein